MLLLLTIAPVVVIGTLIPELFFAKFGTFLAFLGVGFAPLCGIQIADYFLWRRRRVSLRGIYQRRNRRGRPLAINSVASLAVEVVDGFSLFRGGYVHRNLPKIGRQKMFIFEYSGYVH